MDATCAIVVRLGGHALVNGLVSFALFFIFEMFLQSGKSPFGSRLGASAEFLASFVAIQPRGKSDMKDEAMLPIVIVVVVVVVYWRLVPLLFQFIFPTRIDRSLISFYISIFITCSQWNRLDLEDAKVKKALQVVPGNLLRQGWNGFLYIRQRNKGSTRRTGQELQNGIQQ